MGKTLTIAPVTRIEGHAKITINLDDNGNVEDTFVNVVELRGFEKFCIGRPVEELPRIVTSICGVCPWHHHLASAKANDAVFGVTPRAARGIGCVEAPRGTLIHDYETDDQGLITNLNLIVGTTHNNAPINMSVKQTAKALIKNGKYDETILNMVEMAIRAHDPCFSCATHKLDGTLAVKIDLVDAAGNIIDTLTN